MTAYIFKIITLLGGLALFLFGMDIMGKTTEQGDDLENVSCHIFLLYGNFSYFDSLHYKFCHL